MRIVLQIYKMKKDVEVCFTSVQKQLTLLNCTLKMDAVIVAVQSLSCVRLFVTPQTAARQASLSFTISQSLLRLMSTESVMPSNHLILCPPLLLLPSIFHSIRVFSESVFASGGQSIGVSASASVLPMNIQDWFPLGLTGLISLKILNGQDGKFYWFFSIAKNKERKSCHQKQILKNKQMFYLPK